MVINQNFKGPVGAVNNYDFSTNNIQINNDIDKLLSKLEDIDGESPESKYIAKELQAIKDTVKDPANIDKPSLLKRIKSLNDYISTAKNTVKNLAPFVATLSGFLHGLSHWMK